MSRGGHKPSVHFSCFLQIVLPVLHDVDMNIPVTNAFEAAI